MPDFTNTITVSHDPLPDHSRYVLVYADAPAMATVHSMITNRESDGLLGILAIANDCTSEPVLVEQDDDGTWVICQSSNDEVIETIRYAADGEVEHHEVFIPGFTTDLVPEFSGVS